MILCLPGSRAKKKLLNAVLGCGVQDSDGPLKPRVRLLVVVHEVRVLLDDASRQHALTMVCT